jgi:hypothetical protein
MPPRKGAMTKEHKQALAQGRAESAAVARYLDWLDSNRPRRGRKRTPESIRRRLDAISREYAEAAPLRALQLVQEQIDLEAELEALESADDGKVAEGDFIKYAKSYATRKGISYAAFREVGVSPDVLKRARISRAG